MIGVAEFGTSANGCLVYLGFDDLGYYAAGIFIDMVNTMIFVSICRGKGGKGNLYLLISSFVSVAGGICSIFCDYLYEIWNVSDYALEHHKYAGYLKLQLLSTLIFPLGLLALPLIPDTRQKLALWSRNQDHGLQGWGLGETKHKVVVGCLLGFYFVGLYATFTFGWLDEW
eukprot:FR738711.1.p1 GENE.FR738711.1~~FR738711.1.p1  ORF type:complete len:189 (+),score=19.65 FR738711.1:55-567(+)